MPFLSREEEDKVVARLEAVVFEKLGVSVMTGKVGVVYNQNSIDFVLQPIKLNPKMAGPMAHMFKDISVKVGVGIAARDKFLLYFVFHYDYNLPDGGHNGYRYSFEEDFDYDSNISKEI